MSDYASGEVIIYDISADPPSELGRINTGNENNIMGIKIDSNQKIWYVNYKDNNVIRIDYSLIHGDINSDGDINILDVVSLINLVLNNDYNSIADLNNDGVNNILDIVTLVNLVLDF